MKLFVDFFTAAKVEHYGGTAGEGRLDI